MHAVYLHPCGCVYAQEETFLTGLLLTSSSFVLLRRVLDCDLCIRFHCVCIFQRSFSSDVSPAMQSVMTNLAIQQLRMIVPLIRLTDADILQYVILRSAATDSVSSDNSFTSACDAVVDGAEGGIDDDEVLLKLLLSDEN